jgi:hypothetical protein
LRFESKRAAACSDDIDAAAQLPSYALIRHGFWLRTNGGPPSIDLSGYLLVANGA